MSLEKTQKDTFRSYTELKKYPVYETLPPYFEQEYPKLVRFLETYYDEAGEETAEKYLEHLQYKRDFVQAGEDLLRFFSNELLLGRDYFDRFIDKQSAIQTSNLLYRSKGTHYSIQQFFRVFFGFDVNVRYGRDEVFIAGDPSIETDIYQSKMTPEGIYFPTDRIKFTFDDGDIQVFAQAKDPIVTIIHSEYVLSFDGLAPYVEDQDDYVEPFYPFYEYGVYFQLEQDRDYDIDYRNKTVQFLETEKPVYDDPWLDYLAKNGEMHPDSKSKIVVKRYKPAGSNLGSESTEKMITNNGFYQLFALAIQSPVAITKWKEAYKDFVHPAGMYLEGNTLVTSVAGGIATKKMHTASTEQYRKMVDASAELKDFVIAQLTELNIDEYRPMLRTWSEQTYTFNDRPPYREYTDSDEFYAEEAVDSDRPSRVYRTRINDLKNLDETIDELSRSYQSIAQLDTINPRTFDQTVTRMDQTINTVDENTWHKDIMGDIEWGICPPQWVLGDQLDFPPDYVGCPGFVFGVGHQRIQGQYYTPKMMNYYMAGVTSPSYWTDSDNARYIGAQSRTTPGPLQGLGEWKITAKRIFPDVNYYYSIDYTIEIPSTSPTSVWSGFGDFDYSNSWITSKVDGQGTVS